jgi:hypothetical protein
MRDAAALRHKNCPRSQLPHPASSALFLRRRQTVAEATIAAYNLVIAHARSFSRRVPSGRMTTVITGYPDGQLFYLRTHYVTGN